MNTKKRNSQVNPIFQPLLNVVSAEFTIETAEAAINEKGGQIISEKIIRPIDCGGTGMDQEWSKFWAAYKWLRENGYDSDADDIIIEF